MYTDSHCHLTDEAFDGDREAVLQRAREAKVTRIVTVASHVADARSALALAQAHDDVFCTAGVHPHHVGDCEPGVITEVAALARAAECVAIGETGLDYFYDNAPRDEQRSMFEAHVQLGAEMGLPIVVHSREAEADTLAVIQAAPGEARGVVHCFTGSMGFMDDVLEAGWLVSFTGIATFRSFDTELLRRPPADRFMIETDAPYLAPIPNRGRRNEPSFVPHVAEAIAAARGESVEAVAATTSQTAERFFGLTPAEVA